MGVKDRKKKFALNKGGGENFIGCNGSQDGLSFVRQVLSQNTSIPTEKVTYHPHCMRT